MGTLDQIADRALPADARAALEVVLERSVALAVAALGGADPPGRVCAACLYHVQVDDEHDLSLPTLALVLDDHRRDLLNEASPADALATIANPEEVEARGGWIDPEHDPLLEQGRVLVPALSASGVLDAQRWVLCRVARALGSTPPPYATDDFLAFVFDETFDVALVENMRFAATPAAAAGWEGLGLLPKRSTTELEGADPVPFDERVATVEDEYDDDMNRTGRFNAFSSLPGAEGGLWGVTLNEALRWARGHTDLVLLRVGDDEFSAGPEAIPGLPVWDG